MDNYGGNLSSPAPERQEKVLSGFLGAFLFAIPGGILWFILYYVGFFGSISGIIAVMLAMKGYEFFGRKKTKKGFLMSILAAGMVIIFAWYFTATYEILVASKTWFENERPLTFGEAFSLAGGLLADPDSTFMILKDLLIGLGLSLIWVVVAARREFAVINAEKAEAEEEIRFSTDTFDTAPANEDAHTPEQ